MAKKMGYSAITISVSAGMKHSAIAAAAVMIGDSRRTFTLHQKGSSTVSMVAAAYSKNAPRCSSTLKPRPYRASMTSSSRFTVWALPMTPPRHIMA